MSEVFSGLDVKGDWSVLDQYDIPLILLLLIRCQEQG